MSQPRKAGIPLACADSILSVLLSELCSTVLLSELCATVNHCKPRSVDASSDYMQVSCPFQDPICFRARVASILKPASLPLGRLRFCRSYFQGPLTFCQANRNAPSCCGYCTASSPHPCAALRMHQDQDLSYPVRSCALVHVCGVAIRCDEGGKALIRRPIMADLVASASEVPCLPCGRNACITAAIAGSSLAQDHTGRLCEHLAAPQAKIGTKDLLDGVQKQRMARKL